MKTEDNNRKETVGFVYNGGDGGSLVLDSDNYVVGLAFAKLGKITVYTPINKVLESLDIEL